MEGIETGDIKLELKYCERYGALGVRLKGSEMLFCAVRARVMAGLAANSNLVPYSPDPNRRSSQHRDPAFWSEVGEA
jgi:hypothetical protein